MVKLGSKGDGTKYFSLHLYKNNTDHLTLGIQTSQTIMKTKTPLKQKQWGIVGNFSTVPGNTAVYQGHHGSTGSGHPVARIIKTCFENRLKSFKS